MKMKITGFDELEKQLKNMQKAAEELDGTNEVPLSELLPNSFLREHTSFKSFDEFENEEIFNKYSTFEEIPDDEFDQFVSAKTNFSNWNEMLQTAASEYAARKLGF